MRSWVRNATSLAVLLAALWLPGCLALAVPSLAYQGYKYEKDKKQDQSASTASASTSTSDGKQRKSSAASDDYYDTE